MRYERKVVAAYGQKERDAALDENPGWRLVSVEVYSRYEGGNRLYNLYFEREATEGGPYAE